MSGMSATARALAGAICIALVGNVALLATLAALGRFRPTYDVDVVLGELGQGIVPGTDVKMRGVLVGEVSAIGLDDDYAATASLSLRPRYRIPERAVFQVTNKTLLGEKQVEVVFDGPFDDGPYLADGTLVDDPGRVVEFEDVLAELAVLLEAIDPNDLAVVFDDLLGAFEGMGGQIGRSVDAGAQAASVVAGTLAEQVASTRDLSLVAEALAGQGGEFNRLGGAVLEGLPTLSDNQERVRVLLDELAGFSRVLDVTFTVTRPDLDRMLVAGDNVTRLLFDYRVEVGELITGLVSYTENWGPGFSAPGIVGHAARFQIIIDPGLLSELCHGLPEPLSAAMPACAEEAAGADGAGGAPGAPAGAGGAAADTGAVGPTLPGELVRPQPAGGGGLDAVAGRALVGAGGEVVGP